MRLTKLAPTLTLLGLAAATSSLLGGCADNRSTLYINHVLGFGPDDECTAEASLDGEYQGAGIYDQFGGVPYRLTMVVANQLAPLGDNDTLRPETSRIQLQGAVVEITSPAGSSPIAAYTVPFAGTIQPDDSEDPGLASITVLLPLSDDNSRLDPGTYIASITVFGETLAGTDVESGKFDYPISVSTFGAYARCESFSGLEDLGAVHPCGPLSQDGYYVSCGNSTEGPNCSRCN